MRTVLAVDLGGTKTAVARVDADGTMQDRATFPAVRSVEASAGQIASACAGVDAVGRLEKVAAGSTIAAVFIAMALVAATGARLAASGHELTTFVSPNVPGTAQGHNLRVFDAYARRWFERAPDPVARE
jgi:predicted NBD/HSP70 family sugar kinase